MEAGAAARKRSCAVLANSGCHGYVVGRDHGDRIGSFGAAFARQFGFLRKAARGPAVFLPVPAHIACNNISIAAVTVRTYN